MPGEHAGLGRPPQAPAPGDAGTRLLRSALRREREPARRSWSQSSPWKNPAGRRGARAGGGGGAGHMGARSGFTTNRCEGRREGGRGLRSGGRREEAWAGGEPRLPRAPQCGDFCRHPPPQARTHARRKGEPTQRRRQSPRGPGSPHADTNADITTPTAPCPCAPTRPEGAVSSPALTPPPRTEPNRTKPAQAPRRVPASKWLRGGGAGPAFTRPHLPADVTSRWNASRPPRALRSPSKSV